MVYHLWSSLERHQFEHWCTTYWFLWKRRNDQLHGNQVSDSFHLIEGVSLWLAEYQVARGSDTSLADDNSNSGLSKPHWKAHGIGLFKLIVDAALFAIQGVTGMGAVI